MCTLLIPGMDINLSYDSKVIRKYIYQMQSINYIPEQHFVNEIPFNIESNPLIHNLFYTIKEGLNSINYKLNLKQIYNNVNINNQIVIHLKNIYVSAGAISTNYNEIILPHPDILKWLYASTPGKVIGFFHSVIHIGHLHMMSFGHFINDGLNPLMMMPDTVLNASVIVMQENPYIREYIKYLGLNNDICCVHNNEWVYAENLYYPGKPKPHLNHPGNTYRKLGLLFRKGLNLTDVVPDRYILSNRKTEFRRIINMNEIYNKTKTEFPEYNWELDEMIPRPLPDLAKIWGHAKILFCVCGSNMMNCFILPKGCVIIALFDDTCDISAIHCAIVSQAKLVALFDGSIPHFSACNNTLKFSQLRVGIKSALYYQTHGQWPCNSDGLLYRY